MSDAPVTELPAELKEEVAKIRDTTKKGFDLKARLENRGLRKASITLFLDDEKGLELGWAQDVKNGLGDVTERERVGVVGQIDLIEAERESARSKHDALASTGKALGSKEALQFDATEFDTKIAELEAERDKLIAELNKTAIVISMRAVPPVIQKDCGRKARATLGIAEKGVPEDRVQDYNMATLLHLMTVMFQSITDNESGSINTAIDYDEAQALVDLLPPGQFDRLDRMIGQVQFTDAISRSIEGQEDFS